MATKLDLADAQFIGYAIGKREPGIMDLVISMGLTKKEWDKWKTKYNTDYLTTSEINEINEYFDQMRPNLKTL